MLIHTRAKLEVEMEEYRSAFALERSDKLDVSIDLTQALRKLQEADSVGTSTASIIHLHVQPLTSTQNISRLCLVSRNVSWLLNKTQVYPGKCTYASHFCLALISLNWLSISTMIELDH